jgi:hypothetical protein
LKFKDERPFASVDAAVKKLLAIANGLEADHAGRLQIGRSTNNSSRPVPALPNTRRH